MNRRLIGSAIIVTIGLISGFASGNVSHVAAASTLLVSSVPDQNQAKYIRLLDYPKAYSNWPSRDEGCGGPITIGGRLTYVWDPTTGRFKQVVVGSVTITDKSLPYLGDERPMNRYNYDGNQLTAVGTCSYLINGYKSANYIKDGGTATIPSFGGLPGPWISPSAYDNWATNDSLNWGNAFSTVGTPVDSGKLSNAGYANRIWGSPNDDLNEQSDTLFHNNGWTDYSAKENGWGLYSNGTTLFRASFSLTEEEYNAIQNGTAFIQFKGVADDWFQAYINGVPFAGSVATIGVGTFAFPGAQGLKIGQNELAIQTIDKATWYGYGGDKAYYRATGLAYDLTLEAAPAPPQTSPYVNVYGGDVVTGGGIKAGNSCLSNDAANIVTWNRNDQTFSGAGTQFAARATGDINGFATAQHNSGNPSVTSPTGLAFANSNASLGTGVYGGKLGSTPPCIDYVSRIPSGISPTGSQTIPATTVPNGPTVKYVKGNVYILGDITYQNSFWSSIKEIPSYKLVVEGNIYISSAVRRLDGLYVAVPASNGDGGTIYTCATGMGEVPTTSYDSSGGHLCSNQLVVNGSFVAKKVKLLRTCGTLGLADITERPVYAGGTDANKCSDSNHAAEVFNYSALDWLTATQGPLLDKYDAATSLPPVL